MANPKVTVEINGKDNVTPVIKKVNVNLKEMGEKVSQLGMRMGAAFTLPLVGLGMALNKFGAESSKAVDEVRKSLDEAMKSGDPSRIQEAQAAYAALAPNVIKAADAYKQMQAALKPVNDAMDKAKATMLQALVPVLIRLTPLIVNFANGIANLADQFMALPDWAKTAVIGLVAFAGIAPLVITGVGQIIGTIGILKDLLVVMPGLSAAAGTGLKGLGAAFGLVTLPVLALTAAIGALVWLIQNGWLERAITSFKQLAFLIAYALTNMGIGSKSALLANAQSQGLTRAAGGPVSGGSPYLVGERGPEMFVPGSSGAIVPNHRLSAGGGGGITIVYSPTISTASTDEIERMGKLIEQAQRRRP